MSSAHTLKSQDSQTDESETRRQLVLAALDQFASHGIDGVSLRAITAAAGQANQSAVHYHFSNKTGLVAAVLDFVNEMLEPMQTNALAEFSRIRGSREPALREIVAIFFEPYIVLYIGSPLGRKAIRFLARLTWQAGSSGQGLLVRKVWPYFQEMVVYLRIALPGKSAEALALHSYMSLTNLIHGLADTSLLGVEPRMGIDQLYRRQPDAMRNYFYDYIAAGLASSGAN